MRRARGQALVETVIVAALFGTVLAALPVLAALHDAERIAHRLAQDESQISAWRDTGTDRARRLRAEAALQLFTWSAAEDRPVLEADDLRIGVSNGAPPGRAVEVLGLLAAPLSGPDAMGDRPFELSRQGYRHAVATAPVRPMRGAPAPFTTLDLAFTREGYVLTDAWNAGSSTLVAARVGDLVPTRKLEDASRALDGFRTVLGLIEPSFEAFCPGRISVEDLPASRLGALATAPARGPQSRGGSCR